MFSVVSSIYGKIADVRNRLYDKGIFDTFDLGAHAISIGNITTGGTGKTPLVVYVAGILVDRGETVCILTRGYGRKDPKKRVLVSDGKQVSADAVQAGDEPVELAQKLIGKAIVIADADRVAAAEWAKRKFDVTVFVLDDGFQHRRARRDVDIVCIDATNPVGFGQAGSLRSGRMLPAGRLREPLANLSRADVIVITRADLVDDIVNLKFEISGYSPDAKIFEAKNRVASIRALSGGDNFKKDTPAFAFCGIGNRESFYSLLQRNNVEVAGTRSFRDHHQYSQTDIDDLQYLAASDGADSLITTAKDAVKILNFKFEIPCFVVEIETLIDDPAGFAEII